MNTNGFFAQTSNTNRHIHGLNLLPNSPGRAKPPKRDLEIMFREILKEEKIGECLAGGLVVQFL